MQKFSRKGRHGRRLEVQELGGAFLEDFRGPWRILQQGASDSNQIEVAAIQPESSRSPLRREIVLVRTGSTAALRADETRHCVGIAIDRKEIILDSCTPFDVFPPVKGRCLSFKYRANFGKPRI